MMNNTKHLSILSFSKYGYLFLITVVTVIVVVLNDSPIVVSADEDNVPNEKKCFSNDSGETQCSGSEGDDNSPCTDTYPEHCPLWASIGECDRNSIFMHQGCRKSCFQCPGQRKQKEQQQQERLTIPRTWGESQQLPLAEKYGGEHTELTEPVKDIIRQTKRYMQQVVYNVDNNHIYSSNIRKNCLNRDSRCSIWAAQNECNNNPNYMKNYCAPACQSCEYLDPTLRCEFNDNDEENPKVWSKPGDLNKMFENIINHPYYEQYEPQIISKPIDANIDSTMMDDIDADESVITDGPWLVTLENFLTDEECDRLIELGGQLGYEQSGQFSDNNQKLIKHRVGGSYEYEKRIDNARSSTNAWCDIPQCYTDPIVQGILNKMDNLTGIPETYAEHIQLLKYEINQEYVIHHDYIPLQKQFQPGVRIFTLFLYLNDVEDGGETDFSTLGIKVIPQKGKALIWPNVFNQNADRQDVRTYHAALPVKKGIKYSANAWYHARDFKTPFYNGCT